MSTDMPAPTEPPAFVALPLASVERLRALLYESLGRLGLAYGQSTDPLAPLPPEVEEAAVATRPLIVELEQALAQAQGLSAKPPACCPHCGDAPVPAEQGELMVVYACGYASQRSILGWSESPWGKCGGKATLRTRDELQHAHDVVKIWLGQPRTIFEMLKVSTVGGCFQALCWVLGHEGSEGITAFLAELDKPDDQPGGQGGGQ